jgi:hypothetical protein
MATLYYESQYFTTTLSVIGGINASVTTGIVLQAVSGVADTTKPGIALLSYSDPLNTTVCEWVTFTSINSTTKTLAGVTRGAEGFSAKTHANGVTVAFPHSKSHINNIIPILSAISSDTAVGLTTTQTVTNKTLNDDRINPRVVTQTSTGAITINSDITDTFAMSAQAVTGAFGVPSGTPVDGQKLIVRIKDNATSRALTWSSATGGFTAGGATLPTATVTGKYHHIGFSYVTANSLNKWMCLAAIVES